jgi:SAM-dependent methyltransferase
MTRAVLYAACAGFAFAASSARALEEVPFITTPDNVTLAMLELARVGPRDFVIDLGSGDGRIVITAAKRFGARGLGVEIVPALVRESLENAKRTGVAESVEFREQDLFRTDLAPASVVTMYLLPDVNLQLRPSLLALKPGTRIVSHDWDMGDWKPDRSVSVAVPDKRVGLEKSSRVHLWVIPAKVDGNWCGAGNANGIDLRLQQSYQEVRAEVTGMGRNIAFEGKVDGISMLAKATGPRPGTARLQVDGFRLKVLRADGSLAPLAEAVFTPRSSGGCA